MMNELIIDGNLGSDPQFKKTANDKAMAYFSIAHTKIDKDKTKRSVWIKIICFDWTAKLAMGLKKGDRIVAKGPMDYKSYVDKNNATQWSIEMIANSIVPVRFIETSEQQQTTQQAQRPQNGVPQQFAPPPSDFDMQDIPF